MSTVTLYHYPQCSTSRKALELLRERGIEPTIVEYRKTPPLPYNFDNNGSPYGDLTDKPFLRENSPKPTPHRQHGPYPCELSPTSLSAPHPSPANGKQHKARPQKSQYQSASPRPPDESKRRLPCPRRKKSPQAANRPPRIRRRKPKAAINRQKHFSRFSSNKAPFSPKS